MRTAFFSVLLVLCSEAYGEGIEVNGAFETGDGLGWTQWGATWGLDYVYDFAASADVYEGASCLRMTATKGSFGVYQEFCVEPGVPFDVAWAWKGKTDGSTGWWELLIVDAPYSLLAVDDPVNHPETTVVVKWEVGFGGPYPAPSDVWVEETGSINPTSDVVTLVLKCGSTAGPVEVSFDAVEVTHASNLVDLTSISPAKGKTAGGERVTVTGVNLTPGAVVTIGGADLIDPVRLSTCAITGIVPPGPEGPADVVVTTENGTATLPGGYTYMGIHRFLRGDCNDDTGIDIADAICILQLLFGGITVPASDCLAVANSNGDATNDVSDAVYLLRHLFTAQASPPEPYPSCGTGAEEPGCATGPVSCQ
jgi:hypothetical protein